ncbi:hypothetical protein [Aureivirga marina]|uniref:hypothetical protein n=1 Tax=Aureivirga marina TaxID=1182451 RepID=UPI0018C9833A|nr:hypothetical protein [Aureivirga marina]
MKVFLRLLILSLFFIACSSDDDSLNMPTIIMKAPKMEIGRLASANYFYTRIDLKSIYYVYDGNNLVVEFSSETTRPDEKGFQIVFGNKDYDAQTGNGILYYVDNVGKNATKGTFNLDDLGAYQDYEFTIYIFPVSTNNTIADYDLFYNSIPLKGNGVNKKIRYNFGKLDVEYDCSKITDPSVCECTTGVPKWHQEKRYYTNDIVEYNGTIYKAKMEITSYFPPTNSTSWDKVGLPGTVEIPLTNELCSSYLKWENGESYVADTKVTFDKGVYAVKTTTMSSQKNPSESNNFEFIGACECD